MLKSAFNTLLSKILSAVFSLSIVILTTHMLGSEGRGEISLITADIGLVMLFSQLVGGASMVYLYPRSQPFQLLFSAIVWAIISPLIILPIMQVFGMIEHGYFTHLLFLCILFGISSCFQMVALGAEKINWYNWLTLLQTVLLFVGLIIFFFFLNEASTFSYVSSLYFAYLFPLLIGLFSAKKWIKNYTLQGLWLTTQKAIIYGATVQFSNIIQFFNYRLSYFFLSKHLSSLGIFSISLVLAEAVWLIGNSLSLVHYSKVTNESSREDSILQTFFFAKLSFWATLLCVIFLIIFPPSFYGWIFGEKFRDAWLPTVILCPGILAIGFGMVFSHYFAGTGRFKLNNKAALVGLAIKIPACIYFIPKYAEVGAAFACTLSYSASFLFFFYYFKKETNFSLKNLAITDTDIKEIFSTFKKETIS